MGAALQVRSARLAVLIARALQRTMMTACAPPSQGVYLDHVDPRPEDAEWTSGDGVVTLRMPLAVFTVTRADLLAHPDREPAGASVPSAQVTLAIDVSASSGVMAFTVRDVEGVPDALAGDVVDLVGSPPDVDLRHVFDTLGEDLTAGGRVELAGDLLVARFGEPEGPVVPVTHDFEWALFLDGGTVAGLLEARVPPSLPPLQSVRTEAAWRPDGWVMARASIRGPMEVPPPAVLEVTVDLGCNVSVDPAVPELRIDVGYSLDFWTGALAYEPSVALAVEAAETLARDAVDPAAFGGVRTSESSFGIRLPLPEIEVAGERWSYEGMKAGDPGLVIGGRMNLPVDLSGVRLSSRGGRFSGGSFLGLFCSKGDLPSEVARADLFSTVAEVSFEGGGRLCEVEVLPEAADLARYLTLPAAPPLSGGVRPGEGRIFLALGVTTANAVREPVVLVLRTARGVRCHSLGVPEGFTVLEDGTVDGATVMYFDDCNALPHNFDEMTPEEYDRWSGMIWYTYWDLVPGRDYDPDNPPIIPDTLEEVAGSWGDIAGATAPDVIDTTLTRTPPDQAGVTDADSMAVSPLGVDTSPFEATEEGSTVDAMEQATASESDHG